jgi:type II secretory pathway pseudopilin PulG
MTSASPSPAPRRRPRAASAFTLIELLVAGAVTAILVALMLTIVVNILRSWNQSQGHLATNATARQVFSELQQDIQAMLWRADGQVWLAATLQRPQQEYGDSAAHESAAYPEKRDKADWGPDSDSDYHGKPRDPSLSLRIPSGPATPLDQLRFGPAGVWLRFISTRSKPEGKSVGASAVSYQLVRRAPKKKSTYAMYDLQRITMTAAFKGDADDEDAPTASTAFGTGGYDLFAPAYHSYTDVNGARKSAKIRTTERKFSLGPDVIDFGVRIYEATSAFAFTEVFPIDRRSGATSAPSRLPFTYALCSRPGHLPPPGVNYLDQLGDITYGHARQMRFEFMIRVLTPEGVTKLRAYEDDPTRFPEQTWWEIAEAHSRVFTHVVAPLASPL